MSVSVGNLVKTGWDCNMQKPFIGIVTKLVKSIGCCWVYVNGKFQWCTIDELIKV